MPSSGWIGEAADNALDAVEDLASVIHRQYAALPGGDPPLPLSNEGWGAIDLYLRSILLSLGSAERPAEELVKKMDEMVWEITDHEGGQDAS